MKSLVAAIFILLIVGGVIWRIATPFTVTSGSDLAHIASDVDVSPENIDFCGIPANKRHGTEWPCQGGKAALFWTSFDLESYLYDVQEAGAGDRTVVLGPYWVWVPDDSGDAETAAKRLRWYGGRLHTGRRLPDNHRWRDPGSSVVPSPTASESSEPTTRDSEYGDLDGEFSDAEPEATSTSTSTSTHELTTDHLENDSDTSEGDRSSWSDCDKRIWVVTSYEGFADEDVQDMVEAIRIDCDPTPGTADW